MPEETIVSTAVRTALDNLEDFSLDNHISRIQNYNTVLNALEKDEDIDAESLKRLLAVCVHDTTILKYTATVINIIQAILAKVKIGNYYSELDLVPSALTVLSMIRTIALVNKVDSLMIVSFDTVLSYPDKTLVAVAESHEEVLEVFNLYCSIRVPAQIRSQACSLLYRLLVVLPPEKRRPFVEKGIPIWFSKIIPTVMSITTAPVLVNAPVLEVLEMLTDELVDIEYAENPQWQNILACICNTKQYPAVMKNLLNTGNTAWSRLWIVFIRLLKNQITQLLNNAGSPINSMLPVVETAFKLDVESRSKAFDCWNVLIDSFSTETNESNINKRIKLLIIPLRSNNAKTEDTALAKFGCWWHLITKFQNKMDKFLDTVLVTFLQFCFGRHSTSDKAQVVPGLLSAKVKKQCHQAVVDMVGHVNCDGCTELAKLKTKLINTKHLVDNWNHWIYSLTSVIMKVNSSYGLTKQQLTCLWKSFLMTIGELAENNIRKDLFSEILSIIDHLVQECKSNKQFLDIAFNILILSLFAEDTKIKHLFKSDEDSNDPVTRIVKTILNPSLYGYYASLPSGELATKLKAVTKFVLDEEVCSPQHITGCLLDALPASDYGLAFWNALAESVCEANYRCTPVIHNILLWPLKSIPSFKDKTPAMTWYTTFVLMYPTLNKTDIDKEISAVIFSTPDIELNTVYFKLCIVLGVLKLKITETNCSACEKEINLLLTLTKSIDKYENFDSIFPIMVDRIVVIMSFVSTNVNETVTPLILVCVKNVLNILTQACKLQSNVTPLMVLIANLLKPLETLFAVDLYAKLIPAMTYHLLRCWQLLSEHASTRNIYLSVMKTILTKTKVSDTNYNKLKSLINDVENQKLKAEALQSTDINVDGNKFTKPQTNEVPKRSKKKEINIVDTVVEDGEEYVVVQSNWKFNPKKLTENQKEKLQKKREDIPALYQDLSQSQDDCKLIRWKFDTQDTTSNSKSESKTSNSDQSKETDTEFLKNLPSTNVVPKILETFFSEKEKNDASESLSKESPKDNLSKTDRSPATTRSPKSPRMALKDRVFLNVRNLIESSGLQKESEQSKNLPDDPNKTDSNIKTPTHSITSNTANIVNSAPPLLSADRPSRVKRKPKKFEDLQLLTKRSRNSLNDDRLDKGGQLSDESPPNKNDMNKDNKSSALNSFENEKDSHNNLQESTDQVISMDIDNDNANKKDNDKNTESITPNCKDKPIITSMLDIVMTDNEKTKEKSDGQCNVEQPSEGQEIIVPTITIDEKEQTLMPKLNRNTNEGSTPKTSNMGKGVSTPITPNDIKEIVTPKASKLVKEISTPVTSKNIREMSTPKSSKNLKQVATPKLSNPKAGSTLKSSKDNLVPTPTATNKDVSIPTSTVGKYANMAPKVVVEVDEISTPVTSKNVREMSTPKSSKNLKQGRFSNAKVSTTSKSSKDINVLSTPTTTNINGLSTPDTSTANKGASVASKVVLEDEEISPPVASKNISDTTNPKASKNLKQTAKPKSSNPKSGSTNNKEVSTPGSSTVGKGISIAPRAVEEISIPVTPKNMCEMSTPKSAKNLKQVATPKSADAKAGSTLKSSKDINLVSTPTVTNNKEVSTTVSSTVGKDTSIALRAVVEVEEISIPVISKNISEMTTPKSSKNLKQVTTPKLPNAKAGSTLKSSKDINVLSTPTTTNNKEISAPSLSTADKDACIPPKVVVEVATTTISKDVSGATTSRSFRGSKEVLASTMSKDSKESTPKATTDGIKVSTDKTRKDIKSVGTPKISTDSQEVFNSKKSDIEDMSTSKTSTDPIVTLSPNTSKEVSTSKETKESKENTTPKQSPKGDEQKSATKKNTVRKSRIEKELAIDMVEGHPYLQMQSQKRLTRKTVESASTGRRKSLAEKLNKCKFDGNSSLKSEKKNKEKTKESEKVSTSSIVVDESQERDSEPKDQSSFSDELPYSDDVIESSQDSTVTTISVKSTRKTPKKVPVVCVEKLVSSPGNNYSDINNSQSILECVIRVPKLTTTNHENKDDSVLPLNKTAVEDKPEDNLTENMDTEPLDEQNISEDVILINENSPALTITSEDSIMGPETQEIAEADTQPTDPKDFMDIDETPDNIPEPFSVADAKVIDTSKTEVCNVENEIPAVNEIQAVAPKSIEANNTVNIATVTLSEAACADIENSSGASSPFKDEAQRQQDFLNNTIEISPIKTMSPDRNKKSPSPETSSDYVVITLSSPVHSNGEPFGKCDSPEVFTEDKASPDKRDQSPPRVEISVTSSSPTTSLSLKKNRPQVRSGGRAAQMLGLCVPDKVQAIVNPERNETEEVKKSATNTPARRNLRILYNSVADNIEGSNSTGENEDSENFLKFRRSLPAVDSSPSGPILKRKLAEIADEATMSPACKRKRVSFHDPPVSTTVSVQKYIEPGSIRSPQNSAHKRLERQLRQHTPLKSPKRLDSVFKLDTVLTKTVESFSDNDIMPLPDDTQAFSLDETPEVEIVRASELNDSDPICPDLLHCKDPIENIAGELSSSAMKSLLIKELEGKIETVGDLAKMTELEVNRLCIKAPKVKVAKKVLTDYVLKKAAEVEIITLDDADFEDAVTEAEPKGTDIQIQSDRNEAMVIDVQTKEIPTSITCVQIDTIPNTHTGIQTNESDSKAPEDINKSCLSESPDFVEQLGDQLEDTSIQRISEKLPLSVVTDLLLKKITPSETKIVLNRILEQECSSSHDRNKEISFIRDYLCGRFDIKDLVLLCSQILKAAYDKPA